MKYKNYKELKDAYDKGELDREKDLVQVDNDDIHLFVDDVQVFQGEGYADLETILSELGVPCEWV